MLVFFEERLVLLSAPKTASTAYQAALSDRADLVVTNPPELKHLTVRRFDRFFQNMFRKMFDAEMEVMGIVREPIDWLGSWYRYRSRAELIGHPNATHDLSFDAFVRAYLSPRRPAFADFGTQAAFFQPRSNGAGVTHLFRYENQDKILAFLQERLRCEINPPRLNVSPKRTLDLSDDMRKRYMAVHSDDFRLHDSAQ
ncbi:MAG: gamma-glutamyl kinase [Ruegeria sp.]